MILPASIQTIESVAAHYDELDPVYRDIWGEHVHHGLWTSGEETAGEAVEALVDVVATRLDLEPGLPVIDIGCGYGAAARRISEIRGVRVTGVTISAVQAGRAVGDIRHQDWLANDFPDQRFARAYAIESSEHMVDKQRFFDEAFRTLWPGGRLVICTWLSRAAPRGWQVRHLLEPICREGRLPGLGDEDDYRRFAEASGFFVASVEDLSTRVSHTWTICARRLLGRILTDRRYLRMLLDPRARNRVFILTLLRMVAAYRTGSLRYCLMVLEKPQGGQI